MRVLGLCKGHGPSFQKNLGSSHPSRSPHLSWWAPSGELPSHWTEERTAGSSWPDPKIAVPLGDSLGDSSSLHSQSTGDLAEYLSRKPRALRRRPQVARYGTCWASVWVLRTQVVLEQHPNAPGSPAWSSQRWSNHLSIWGWSAIAVPGRRAPCSVGMCLELSRAQRAFWCTRIGHT